jgi:hypothetical protein
MVGIIYHRHPVKKVLLAGKIRWDHERQGSIRQLVSSIRAEPSS